MVKNGLVAVATALALTACTMIDSSPVDVGESRSGQASGSYQLSKHILRVTLTKPAGLPASATTELVPIADPEATMHVAMQLSPTSDDDVTITTEDGLLKRIAATANDRTGDIFIEAAKAFGNLRQGSDGTQSPTFDMDPFNPDEARTLNKILSPGDCVEVELSVGIWSPGCGKYSLGRSLSKGDIYPISTAHSLPKTEGIYFRRPIPHRVHVVLNGKSVLIKHLLFANLGPISRVDIDRTLFVKRETTVDFTAGIPTSVHVVKPSEGLAVAKLPVAILDAYVGGAINTLTQRDKFNEARVKLLNSEANIAAAEAKAKDAAATQAAESAAQNLAGPSNTTTVAADPSKLLRNDSASGFDTTSKQLSNEKFINKKCPQTDDVERKKCEELN